MSLTDEAATLLALHQPGRPVVLPTVWDPWSARFAVEAGFSALTVGSHPVASSLGAVTTRICRWRRCWRWYLNGRELTELRGSDVVSVDQLGVPLDTEKRYKLTVHAVDGTAFVRDRQIRNTLMRDDLSWTVQPAASTNP